MIAKSGNLNSILFSSLIDGQVVINSIRISIDEYLYFFGGGEAVGYSKGVLQDR
jgi:hypothetical protein